MTGTIIPIAIDALIAALQGNAFTVIDGPGDSDENYTNVLFVGLNSTDSEDFIEAATTDQSWPWLGHQMRDETVSIRCLAEVWAGSTVMKTARDLVFATLTAVGTAVQADPSLGLLAAPIAGVNLFQVSGVKAGSYKQTQDENGALASLQFDIQIRGRVT